MGFKIPNNRDKNIGCVFLNACYSAKIVEAISKYIDCVVGMSGGITDEAAITFVQAFYLSLGYGRRVLKKLLMLVAMQ
jgi:hypothetical protein